MPASNSIPGRGPWPDQIHSAGESYQEMLTRVGTMIEQQPEVQRTRSWGVGLAVVGAIAAGSAMRSGDYESPNILIGTMGIAVGSGVAIKARAVVTMFR